MILSEILEIPGPFVHFLNLWLSASDVHRMIFWPKEYSNCPRKKIALTNVKDYVVGK